MKWRYVGIVLSLALFTAALVALHRILGEVHLADILARFRETPARSVLLSVVCVAGSYLALTGYDVLALRQIGWSLPYSKAALASFTSYTFSHNIGFSLLTGGSIRYRIYSAVGLSVTEIATLTGLCALTFGLGASLLLGVALVLEPAVLGAVDVLPAVANRAVGVAILLTVAGYAVWTGRRHRPLKLGNWTLSPPGWRMTLGQFALGVVDISFAAGALYLVLPTGIDIGFAAFAGIYVTAMCIGVVSYSPGGLGVFEAVVLLAMPGGDRGALFGSLLVYRCLYYLLPLAVAAILLSWHEYQLRREVMAPGLRAVRSVAHAVVPSFLGVAVFAGGAILLFSAATPAVTGRIDVLRDFVPLPFVEASHLLSSIVGLWLMILARGLVARLDGAYHTAVAVLAGGALFSLMKGFDYEEALILGVVLVLLVASRPAFRRKASLFNEPFSPAWIATIAVIVLGSVWLGFFAFKHVEYSDALWWEFAYRGDAPRFLRASVAVTVLALGLFGYRLLRPAPPPESETPPAIEVMRRIVAASPRSDANLALTGDKRFLMSDNRDAFIMYQIQGRSWVALGEPVGPVTTWEDLLWRFREMCDRHGGRPVFYQVSADNLPAFLDLGLSMFKLGEDARVDLGGFSLEGSAARELRYAERRAEREGAVFEVVPAADVPDFVPQLRAVSDAWLANKATHEKRFSVGAFSGDYLKNFDCAVVRHDGAIVAFANIWRSPAGQEVSIDLMRYRSDAPYGVMDFLFIRLMRWGKEKGYRWFDLGMAPLSGLDNHPLAPVWQRIGAFLFRHGEHFYNFEGLRAYKEKFRPVWSPKYLAVPGGLALPRILFDIAALTSGGTKEIIQK